MRRLGGSCVPLGGASRGNDTNSRAYSIGGLRVRWIMGGDRAKGRFTIAESSEESLFLAPSFPNGILVGPSSTPRLSKAYSRRLKQ